MSPAPVIALLTDFGLSDAYAGIMKGVILSAAPEALIVDLTHEVPPQAVDQAAFLLETAWRYFPTGTIFLVVVDPGVGGTRQRIAIEAYGMRFIGPDNGCLSAALPDSLRGEREIPGGFDLLRGVVDEGYQPRVLRLDASITAVSIENEALFRTPVSATFEGRDVFAPVAAYLAAGGSIDDLGRRVNEIEAFPAFRAPLLGGKPRGVVIHIDTFGNIITDIRREDMDPVAPFLVADEEVPLMQTYADADPEEIIALVGSSGFVEIALPDGSAADELAVSIGDSVEQL